MKAPDRWWQPHATPGARLLAPLGALYGALTAARMSRPGHRLDVPVYCVGNFVAGGAGKTPTALALARLLLAGGARPAFVSRGYGGTVARTPHAVLRVVPGHHGAAEVGDEPLLLAAMAPTVVGVDRRAAAALAIADGADCVILDDGLQNPSLAKTWTLAAVDGATGLGNGLCLPAGPLRAPAARQWPLVSAVCVIGAGEPGRRVADTARRLGKPALAATIVPDPDAVAALRGHRLLPFAGIGRPAKFAETLRAAGLDAMALRVFPDHHRYSGADLATLVRDAGTAGAVLVTTAKDRVRLPAEAPVRCLPVTLAFERPDAVLSAIAAAMGLRPA